MRFNVFTSMLALSAPLAAVAAPTATAAASQSASIHKAWEIVSSLSGTLNWHEVSINFTLSFLPEHPTDGQKASVNSSVTADVTAMTSAIGAATKDIQAIAHIIATTAEDEIKEAEKVIDALTSLVHRSTGTVKHAATVFKQADIAIIGGGVFAPFVAIFDDFVLGVETLFLALVPGVDLLASTLVGLLATVLALL